MMTRLAVAIAAGALLLSATPTPSDAQSCTGIHNAMTHALQQEGPASPRYGALSGEFQRRCAGAPVRRHREAFERGPSRRAGGAQCRELRQACLNKGQLGERGEGNCRRYRRTCRR
jgi:hypothetical protein